MRKTTGGPLPPPPSVARVNGANVTFWDKTDVYIELCEINGGWAHLTSYIWSGSPKPFSPVLIFAIRQSGSENDMLRVHFYASIDACWHVSPTLLHSSLFFSWFEIAFLTLLKFFRETRRSALNTSPEQPRGQHRRPVDTYCQPCLTCRVSSFALTLLS